MAGGMGNGRTCLERMQKKKKLFMQCVIAKTDTLFALWYLIESVRKHINFSWN
jgi:hypothetical protein